MCSIFVIYKRVREIMIAIGLIVMMIISFIVFVLLEKRDIEGERAARTYLEIDGIEVNLMLEREREARAYLARERPKKPDQDKELLNLFDDIDDSDQN